MEKSRQILGFLSELLGTFIIIAAFYHVYWGEADKALLLILIGIYLAINKPK